MKLSLIEICNVESGQIYLQEFEQDIEKYLTYQELLKIIREYDPQIQEEMMTIMYWGNSCWLFMHEEWKYDSSTEVYIDKKHSSDMDQIEINQGEYALKVKYHCQYLSEVDEQVIIRKINNIQVKTTQVQELYDNLKSKYQKQPLDINIFWSNPLCTDDSILRKGTKPFKFQLEQHEWLTNQKVEQKSKYHLLKNQTRFAPLINSVSKALQNCDKKIHLKIDQLNKDCFNHKNIFKVVYLISHVEVHQKHQKHDKNKEREEKKEYNRRKNMEENKNKIKYVPKHPENQIIKIQYVDPANVCDKNYKNNLTNEPNNQEIQMIITVEQTNQQNVASPYTLQQHFKQFQESPIKHVFDEKFLQKQKAEEQFNSNLPNFKFDLDAKIDATFNPKDYEKKLCESKRSEEEKDSLIEKMEQAQPFEVQSTPFKYYLAPPIKETSLQDINIKQLDFIQSIEEIQIIEKMESQEVSAPTTHQQINHFNSTDRSQPTHQNHFINFNTHEQQPPQFPQPKVKQLEAYFMGEKRNGFLEKINSETFDKILSSKQKRNIQLLILHTSYPYYHLPMLKKHANNIILINSNPNYPEASTIYFIKQLFQYLIKSGNIEEAYESAYADTKLVYIDNELNPHLSEEQEIREVQFITEINERYVHGSVDMCCCYHQHEPNCHSLFNNRPTKYAEYHFGYHINRCDCYSKQHIMHHHCEDKIETAKSHFKVLSKSFKEKQCYSCCCQGKYMGHYEYDFYNKKYFLEGKSPERDIHSMRFKYHLEKLTDGAMNLQISEGRVSGDCNQQFLDSFKYLMTHSLIGNKGLIVKLLNEFSEEETNTYKICNLYGDSHTGRKTIALYLANLLLSKKIFERLIIIKNERQLHQIKSELQKLEKADKSHQNFKKPQKIFYLIIQVQKKNKLWKKQHDSYQKAKRYEMKKEYIEFGKKINALIITEFKLTSKDVVIKHFQPDPFQMEESLAYVKMYRDKHLNTNAKEKLKKMFELSWLSSQKTRKKSFNTKNEITEKGVHEEIQSRGKIYPCSLNEFQILNIIRKSNYSGNKSYVPFVKKIHHHYVYLYVFIMSIVRYTYSPEYRKRDSIKQMESQLHKIMEKQQLFFKDFGKFTQEVKKSHDSDNDYNSKSKHNKNDESSICADESKKRIISLVNLKNYFQLVYQICPKQISQKAITILKLFAKFSCLKSINHKFDEVHSNIKKKIKEESLHRTDYLNIKLTPFRNQIFEATTINPHSYINLNFKKSLEEISGVNPEQLLEESEDISSSGFKSIKQIWSSIQDFMIMHGNMFDSKRSAHIKKRMTINAQEEVQKHKHKNNGHHGKTKDKKHNTLHSSVDYSRDSSDNRSLSTSEKERQEKEDQDIPHIYHLAAVVEAGLQYLRNSMCSHLIYNNLLECQKITLLKFGVILINNALILMKSKTFFEIHQPDLENYEGHSHDDPSFDKDSKLHSSSLSIITPEKMSINKSEDREESLPESYQQRSTSNELYSSSRHYTPMGKKHSFVQIAKENHNSQDQIQDLLIDELRKLSTYKGLLFLLFELEKRASTIRQYELKKDPTEQLLHIKISIELLSIQIRLEQMYSSGGKEERKNPEEETMKDKYSIQLRKVFNDRYYHINQLRNILKQSNIYESRGQNENMMMNLKSNLILALIMMISRCGKTQINNFMIEEVEQFKLEWETNNLSRQQSLPPTDDEKTYIDLPSECKFIFKISENQNIYCKITEALPTVKLWLLQTKTENNFELELYIRILDIYKLFKAKSTNSQIGLFKKLNLILDELSRIKFERSFESVSVYLHNMIEHLENAVKLELQKLRKNLIVVLSSEDHKNYIKVSLSDKLNALANTTQNNEGYFTLKMKLNYENIDTLIQSGGCKYICLSASANIHNSTQIIGELQHQDKSDIILEQNDLVSKIALILPSKAPKIFVCLPKKRMFAGPFIKLIEHRHPKFQVIYFDFEDEKISLLNKKSSLQKLLVYEKMIMAETVKLIFQRIFQSKPEEKQTWLFKKAFNQIRETIEFVIVNSSKNEEFRLKNELFRSMIWLHSQPKSNEDKDDEINKRQIRVVELKEEDKVGVEQMIKIQKIIKNLSPLLFGGCYSNNIKEFMNESPKYNNGGVNNFLSALEFYMKDRYSYEHFYVIKFENFKILEAKNKDKKEIDNIHRQNQWKKQLFRYIITNNILNFIYSHRKGIIGFYFDIQNAQKYGDAWRWTNSEFQNLFKSEGISLGEEKLHGMKSEEYYHEKLQNHSAIHRTFWKVELMEKDNNRKSLKLFFLE